MKTPKIELKNVKYHEGMEGTGVNLDIYINNKKCLHLIDEGNGGCYNYYEHHGKDTMANEVIAFNIKLVDEHISNLKPRTFKIGDNVHTLEVTRDVFFEEILEKHEEMKRQKKIDKLCKTSIVFGNKNAYGYINFNMPLENVPKFKLNKHLSEIKEKYCTSGEMKILNKNLTILGIVL